jgi:hypothetical protein
VHGALAGDPAPDLLGGQWQQGRGRTTDRLQDDGFGFDPQLGVPAAAEQTGLANIRDRVAAIDGRFQVESSPGTGTRLLLELPLAQPQVSDPAPQAGTDTATASAATPAADAVPGIDLPPTVAAPTEPARA